VDKPAAGGGDPDIRFLDPAEVEALVRATPDDTLGPTEAVLYLAAAMTGLRQGELIALRWRDVDWLAGRIRVRQNYVRGEFGTPKSKRSSRSVPLVDRLGGELERHYQRSAYQHDDDLVFAHPLDRSKVLKRFKDCCDRAKVPAGPVPRPAPHLRHPRGRGGGGRCGRCRSGWGTATWPRRWSTRTTSQAPRRASWPSGRSSGGTIWGQSERNRAQLRATVRHESRRIASAAPRSSRLWSRRSGVSSPLAHP
jgi:Phage integrase family